MLYHIMFREQIVADVTTDDNNLVTNITKYVPDSPIQPFWGDFSNATPQAMTVRFYNFLKDRCYEDGRLDLPDILQLAGLETNDPYKWVRVSHGVTWEDFFWIRFDVQPTHRLKAVGLKNKGNE